MSFQTLLIKPLDCCPYKKGVPKPLVLLCIFEMKPLYKCLKWFHSKLCLYNLGFFAFITKGVPKPSVLYCFFQMKPLSVFLKWFHFKLCLYLFVWLNILEIQLQKHWFYNGCITNNSKSIAFISNTNLRTTQKILVKCTDIKSVQKLSQTQQKVMKSRQVSEALKNDHNMSS